MSVKVSTILGFVTFVLVFFGIGYAVHSAAHMLPEPNTVPFIFFAGTGYAWADVSISIGGFVRKAAAVFLD